MIQGSDTWQAHPIWFKLGHIVPHLRSDLTPYQFYRVAPPGVLLVTVPLDLGNYSRGAVEQQLPFLWDRVQSLVDRNVDRVVLAGVPVAAALGRETVLGLVAEISQRAQRNADSDLEAHLSAMRHLGVSRIAMATRWGDDLNQALVAYLAAGEIEVVSIASTGRDLAQNKASDPNADHELMLELGRRAVLDSVTEPDALFLPGGLGLVVDVAATLENELRIPVLINVTSTLWAALSSHPLPMTGGASPYPGRLLRTLAQPS
jgi:maleate cis-trans isomerase